jgi:hypothetical protein
MNFEMDEEAYKFYNDYALIVGFSTVKSGTYTSRNKKQLERLQDGYTSAIVVGRLTTRMLPQMRRKKLHLPSLVQMEN